MRKKLILDGNNLLHRCYWLTKNNKRNSRKPFYHYFLFIHHLKNFIDIFEPSEILICWDKRLEKGYNERRDLLDEYKTNKIFNPSVYENTDDFFEALSSLGIKQLFPKYREADDIMFWLCTKKYPNHCILVSSDSDMYQMILPQFAENIIYNPAKKKQVNEYYLRERYDVNNGIEFIIVKSLRGDLSDNIDGIPFISRARINEVIDALKNGIQLDKLAENEVLSKEEQDIFIRNLRLMKLDFLGRNEDEIEIYERQLKQEVSCNEEIFRSYVSRNKFWIIENNFKAWWEFLTQKPSRFNENIFNAITKS